MTRESTRELQSGFALLAGLFLVIAVAGVTLIALMSMTLSSSKVSQSESAAAREIRAADNALESAINMMRMDPDALLGNVENCIDPAGIPFESNGRTVTVTGTCEQSPQLIRADTATSPTAPEVRLVGPAGYQSPTGFGDTVHWSNDCLLGDPDLGSCAPWVLGIGSANYNAHAASEFGAAVPSFIHAADDDPADNPKSLTVSGDVLARHGSATMIPPSGAEAAAQVAGQYQQADRGLFADQGSIDCGIGTVGHPWNVLAAQVVDSDEAEGIPTCGAAATEAADLDPRAALDGVRPAFGDTFTSFALPAANITCPAGAVLELPPGAYGKAHTARLNDLLGGGCPGKTFWFKSTGGAGPDSSYWFDVDDPSNGDRALWNSLIIGDPTVRVIFGTPAGGTDASAAAAAVFPAACDPAATGVEITLSPRTTIRHLAGRVAVCDSTTGAATTGVPAAIWQTGNADGGWLGHPDPDLSTATIQLETTGEFCFWLFGWICWPLASGNTGWNGGSENNGWIADGVPTDGWTSCTAYFTGGCVSTATFEARGMGTKNPVDGTPATPPSPGRVDTLDVVLTGETNGEDLLPAIYNNGGYGTEVRLYLSDPDTPACAMFYPYAPRTLGAAQPPVLAFDLLSPVTGAVAVPGGGNYPRCRDLSIDRASLQGAGVDIAFTTGREIPIGNTVTMHYYVDGIQLRAGWDLVPSTATGGSGWNDAAKVLVTDDEYSGYTLSGCPVFQSCATATRYVDIGGFDNILDPHVPVDGTLQAAGLVVTGDTTDQNWFAGGSIYDADGEPDISDHSWMRATVSGLRDGGSCTTVQSRLPYWGEGVYLDLLGPCALTSSEQLIGASLRLEVYVERNSWGAWVDYGARIDSVRLSTVTSGDYTRPRSPMSMTIGDGPSNDSSFNTFGQVSMPRNDLNVRWNGPTPVDGDGNTVALIGGNTILSGLGSYVPAGGEAGAICCSPSRPAERIVDLVASVPGDGGPRVVGTARVVISDVAGPGSGVEIESWSLA